MNNKKSPISVIISILLLAAILCAFVFVYTKSKNENKQKPDDEPVESTENVVKKTFKDDYKEVIAKLYNKDNLYSEYTLNDIDKDGTPELIYKSGESEATAQISIYTFNTTDYTSTLLGEVVGGHSVTYGTNEKYLIVLTGQMDIESVYHVSIEGQTLKTVTVEDAVEVTEYKTFDNELTYTKGNDYSLLENYN